MFLRESGAWTFIKNLTCVLLLIVYSEEFLAIIYFYVLSSDAVSALHDGIVRRSRGRSYLLPSAGDMVDLEQIHSTYSGA